MVNEDGWYMCAFKYTGKPTSFTIKVAGYMDQTATVKSNSFVVVNFDPTATGEAQKPRNHRLQTQETDRRRKSNLLPLFLFFLKLSKQSNSPEVTEAIAR